MIEGQFSRTALIVAGLRAAHQSLDGAAIFKDPHAAALLGADAEGLLARVDAPDARPLRLFVALRTLIAEDAARAALARGVRQAVVLGAGLDTFAYRLEPLPGLRVFEVDHPATQGEKRRRLSAAGIAIPEFLTFAPCDFEREPLAAALASAGFDSRAPSAYLWLGVTPYLTPDAIESTLRFVAGAPGGADIVFDYTNPASPEDAPDRRAWQARMTERVGALGEAFHGHFETPALHALLREVGFADYIDLGPREIAARLRPGGPPRGDRGGHILHAWTKRA